MIKISANFSSIEMDYIKKVDSFTIIAESKFSTIILIKFYEKVFVRIFNAFS